MEQADPDALRQSIGSDATIQDALRILQESDLPALTVLHPRTGEPAGLLVRPGATVLASATGVDARCERIGGMATPLGVYLHDGMNGGGVGYLGLALAGAMLGFLSIVSQTVASRITAVISGRLVLAQVHSPGLAGIIAPLELWATNVLVLVLSLLGVLASIRLLPLSGTHAAEHQVVHSVEQGVPLTIPHVGRMPRVHPRCGTNLLAGLMMFTFLFAGVFMISQVRQANTFDAATYGVIVAAPITLACWKRFGGFLQYWLATKPATRGQLANAIQAAEQLLERRRRSARNGAKEGFVPLRRIWAIGLPQVATGCALAYGCVKLVAFCWPALGSVLDM